MENVMNEIENHVICVGGQLKIVDDIDVAINEVKKSAKALKDENIRLREQIKFLEEEYSRDAEIQKYKEELANSKQKLNNEFSIPNEINDMFNKWKEKHIRRRHWDKKNDCPKSAGAASGRFSYIFTPTALGTIIECRCICGKSISELNE